MKEMIELKLAFLIFSGIAAQWFAWRFKIPAISLLLLAGLVAGPFTGFIVPSESFGEVYKPAVTLAVSIILFEGGLTLNFREIRETSKAVRRIVLIGAPLTWLFGTLAAHYIGGLSWLTAIVLSAILIVTGPTVIMPLLRHAKLEKRVASLLRWEAIVNDPLGALFAVISFETYLILNNVHEAETFARDVVIALLLAGPGAYALGKSIIWLFANGHIPEYLKAPFVLAIAVGAAAVTNMALAEAGLLTVTVLGIVLGNSRLASLDEMKRFKETITVVLVSSVFILLTASLDIGVLRDLGWNIVFFVLATLFIVRPLAIWIATINTGATPQERTLTAFIAPRGIVAVAIAGLFGTELSQQGVEDGQQIVAFTFAVVATTIVLHGFGLSLLARLLKLRSMRKPGVLFVGATPFSIAMAEKLADRDVPVLIADQNWNTLRNARDRSIEVYYGDVLSEHAHHNLHITNYRAVIAVTDNHAYNSLVCSAFAAEAGRDNTFQLGRQQGKGERQDLLFTIGGRPLVGPDIGFSELNQRIFKGHRFSLVKLTETYGMDQLKEERDGEVILLLWIAKDGKITFASNDDDKLPEEGDEILVFGKPSETRKRVSENGADPEEPEQ